MPTPGQGTGEALPMIGAVCTRIDKPAAARIDLEQPVVAEPSNHICRPTLAAQAHKVQVADARPSSKHTFEAKVLESLARQEARLELLSEKLSSEPWVELHANLRSELQNLATRSELQNLANTRKVDESPQSAMNAFQKLDCDGQGIPGCLRSHSRLPDAEVQAKLTALAPPVNGLGRLRSTVEHTVQRHIGKAVHRAGVTRSGRCSRLQHILQGSSYDLVLGVIVSLNIVCMFAQFQWQGYDSAYRIGLRNDNHNWDQASHYFFWCDCVFDVYYLIDLMARLIVLSWSYFGEAGNFCDTVVVIVLSVERFVLIPINGTDGLGYLQVARAIRFIRILRVVKILKVLREFHELRVLVQVLLVARNSLVWGIMLVSIIIASCGIFMACLGQGFIERATDDPDMQLWVYENFGSSTSASWTLFEAAFTGSWIRFAKRSIDDWSSALGLFWVFYVLFVNFTVVRVISAMFLKQTMAVASADAESMAICNTKRRELYALKIRNVFELADRDNSGAININEFKDMLKNADVIEAFAALHLEPEEVELLFGVLSDEDGEADYLEFLEGALRMKGQARTIDSIIIQREQARMLKLLVNIDGYVSRFGSRAVPKNKVHA